MNTESVSLRMTPAEADNVAYVLMASLKKVTMRDRERTDATLAVNTLFAQLGYGHRTDANGNRIELTS